MRKTAATSITSDPAELALLDLLHALRRNMGDASIELLLAFHEGAHFIEKANGVRVLTGFKSIGPALVALLRAGASEGAHHALCRRRSLFARMETLCSGRPFEHFMAKIT
jgi:hypothetical protein